MIHELPDQKAFTPKEAAYYLGISVKTIYQWVNEGKLEAVRIGEKLIQVSRESITKKEQDINL